MSKENQTEEKKEKAVGQNAADGKAVTKYDRKMEKRKKEEEKERKSWLRFKIACAVIVAAVVVAVLVSIGSGAYRKYSALHSAYITVGDHEITQVEFDYYFHNSVNSFISMYGDYVSMFGLDTTAPLDEQPYTDEMTWKDYFDQVAVSQIQQVKAMVDDAAANGFTYDDTEDIAQIESEFAAGAESEAVSEAEYYVTSYGEYATAERILPFIKENVLATAYHTHLLEINQPTEEEIAAYYEENKLSYDTVDFRSFYFEADLADEATEEETADAMEELKAEAEKMVERIEAGEDFETLCAEYADEDEKENYGGETEGSLTEAARYYACPLAAGNWLFDETRKEGDLAALADDTNNRYYVVEFLGRDNDEEATNESIANALAEDTVGDYITEIALANEVKEGTGKLVYLTVPEETEEGTEESGEAAEESTEAAAESETAAE